MLQARSSWVQVSDQARDFSLLKMSKMTLAPNEGTSQCVTGTLSLGIKGPEREANS